MIELPSNTRSSSGYQRIADNAPEESSIRHSYYQIPESSPGFGEIIVDSQSELKQPMKPKNFSLIIGLSVISLIVISSLASYSNLLIAKSSLSSTAPMSIYVDTTLNEYQVMDNDPLLPSSKQKYHILASGKYLKNVNGNGWHYLEVETLHMESWVKSNNATLQAMSNNTRQHLINEEYVRTMKALGYLEGFVTCHEMNAWYMNFYSGLFDGGDPTEEALEFLESNHNWMSEQADKNYLSNEYWLTVKGLLSQLEGIVAGAKDGCPGSEQSHGEDAWTTPTHGPGIFLPSLHKRPALIHLLLMNANGDLYQIGEKFDQANAPASTVLQNYPNDDDYVTETDNNSTSSAVNASTAASPVQAHKLATPQRSRSGATYKSLKAETVRDKMEQRTMRAKPEFIRRRTSSETAGEDSSSSSTRWTRTKYETARQRRLAREKEETQRARKHTAVPPANPPTAKSTRKLSSLEEEGKKDKDRIEWEIETDLRYLNPIADRKKLHRHDHCSVLIKLTDAKDDIIFAHNTWDDFQNAAPRTIKNYHYNNYRGEKKPWAMFNVLFSSSPGLLSSIDDFFMIKGRGHMAVIETSIDVFNNQLLNLVIPESMLSWTRARLANQLSHSGKSWAAIFSLFHSGTYVNQWMVLDFKKFTPGSNPDAGFLTVLEEVPGYIHFEDMTETLVNTSYWASFNNPYFDDIARLTGQYQLCKDNPLNCYDHDPRGLIFEREQSRVQSIADMQRMIGFNEFSTDPLSLNDSCNAIACRQDLQPNPANRYPFGAIDGKVSSVVTAKFNPNNRPTMYTRLGPSQDAYGPFCWEAFQNAHNHRGFSFFHVQHPACFDFDWEVMPPNELPPLLTFQNPPSSSSLPSSRSSDGKHSSGMRADNTLLRLEVCPEESINSL